MPASSTIFCILAAGVCFCNGQPCNTSNGKCGCYQNRCWIYTEHPPTANSDWCYTQEKGVSMPLKKWKPCKLHSECDLQMTCGSSVRYKGADTHIKDEDQILKCSEGWIKNKTSCYFLGDKFPGLSWNMASEFCLARNAKLVEIRDQDDLDFVTATVASSNWTDGPWTGNIRDSKDKRRWMPASGGVMPTTAFHQKLNELSMSNNFGDCGGFTKSGEIFSGVFGFWNCSADNGSPLCEMKAF